MIQYDEYRNNVLGGINMIERFQEWWEELEAQKKTIILGVILGIIIILMILYTS